MEGQERGIVELHERWTAAMGRGDVDGLLELLDPEYELWMVGRPPIRGRAALRPALEAAFDRYRIEARFECDRREVEGRLAVERGWDIQSLRALDDDGASEQRQRVTLVSRRGDDGVWRFVWGMSLPAGE